MAGSYSPVILPKTYSIDGSPAVAQRSAATFGLGSGVTPNRYRKVLESAMVFPEGVQRREDIGWTQGEMMDLEIPPASYEQMLYASITAYRVNPMARRLIEMLIEFIIGNGVSITSPHVETATAIKNWWSNPYNNWQRKTHPRLRSLYLMGEWIHRPYKSRSDGMHYTADIRSDVIDSVVPDPYNHSEVDHVLLKALRANQGAELERLVPATMIRRRLIIPESNSEGAFLMPKATGDLFYFGINRIVGTYRGVGELFHELDYLNLFDDMIYSRAEKVMAMARMWWDLEVDAVDQNGVNNTVKQLTSVPPKPGGLFAHNTKMKLEARSADLRADDFSTDVAGLRSLIINTAGGWPGTWFDDPGGAGRAVGAEMSEPAIRAVVNKQMVVSAFLRAEIDYYLQSLEDWGLWERPADIKDNESLYAIVFNKPTARDFQRLGPALARVSTLIDTLVSKTKIFQKAEGRAFMIGVLNQLGLLDMPIKLELPTELEPDIDPETGKILDPIVRNMQRQAQQQDNNPAGGTAPNSDPSKGVPPPMTKEQMIDTFHEIFGPEAVRKFVDLLND